MKIGELEFKRWYWNWLWKVGWDKGDWGRGVGGVGLFRQKEWTCKCVRGYLAIRERWGVQSGKNLCGVGSRDRNSRKEIWEDWLTIPRSLGWFGHQFNKGVARSSVLHGTLMREWNAFLLRKLLPWSKRDMAKIWIKIMTMRTQGKF